MAGRFQVPDAGETGMSAEPSGVGHLHEHVPEDVYGSWSASPSPDGFWVAFVSDRDGEPRVWMQGSEPRRLEPLPMILPRVLAVSWSPDGQWLACHTAVARASCNEVWVVRPDGADLHRAAGTKPSTAELGVGRWHGWSADSRLLVTESDRSSTTALLVDPESGDRRVIALGPLLKLLDLSSDGRRALLRQGPRGAYRLAVVDLDETFLRPVISGTGPGCADRGCLAPSGALVYARSDVGREFAALVVVDVDEGRPPVILAERADAELEDFVLAADGATAVLLWNVHGGLSELSVLDMAAGRQDSVGPLPRHVVGECRLSPDGKDLFLTAEDWAHPRGAWTIDLRSGAASPVTSSPYRTLSASRGATVASLNVTDAALPQLWQLRSGDGLRLTGWLYRPESPAPWPTIMYLHGGPEDQQRPVYSSLFQSIIAAGIAVFAPNVRGSTGFGRSFVSADDREGRFGAIADVAACAEYLLANGIAEPGRIGCIGWSYGGYLTLSALVSYPDLFAVGVDVCGIADFQTFFANTEPWIAAAAVAEYGHPDHDAALLRDLSPIHRIDRLTTPLLVIHGRNDTNVPVDESEQVVAALATRGIEHRFLLFEGEGHDLLATPDRVAFVQATIEWVAKYLDVPLV